MEHAWLYAGRQIEEDWAIVVLCAFAHNIGMFQDSGILNKEINEWISLRRATPEDLAKYPNKNWEVRKTYLNKKYNHLCLK